MTCNLSVLLVERLKMRKMMQVAERHFGHNMAADPGERCSGAGDTCREDKKGLTLPRC